MFGMNKALRKRIGYGQNPTINLRLGPFAESCIERCHKTTSMHALPRLVSRLEHIAKSPGRQLAEHAEQPDVELVV